MVSLFKFKQSLLGRNRDYRLLYLGQYVSFVGTMITGVALPYQIYHETHSTLIVGLLSLFQLIPLLLTALIGGVFADRYHRKKLLLITELLLAASCLLLALNAALTTPHIWIIFIVAVVMSAITGLHRPALTSITQQIVAKEDFPVASRLSTFGYNTCMIAGPAIRGVIIAHFGLMTTFIVDFTTFLFSLFALLIVRYVPRPVTIHKDSAWSSLQEGIRYAASRQELLGTYFVDFVAMLFGMPMGFFSGHCRISWWSQNTRHAVFSACYRRADHFIIGRLNKACYPTGCSRCRGRSLLGSINDFFWAFTEPLAGIIFPESCRSI